MSCEACSAAQLDPRRDEWAAGCLSCAARALACIGTLPTDTAAMRRMFGTERLAEGREHFNRWAGVLRRARASQGVTA